MRTAGRIALLVALWLLAWGEVSAANLLSGVAIASAVLLAFPPGHPAERSVRVRPTGVLRLAGYVVAQLVVSNIVMTRQILSRRPDAHPGVLAHPLRHPSDEVVTLMTSIIALSPGTMTVDVDATSSTIYVHFFRLRDVAASRALLDRLERHVMRAITPVPEESP